MAESEGKGCMYVILACLEASHGAGSVLPRSALHAWPGPGLALALAESSARGWQY